MDFTNFLASGALLRDQDHVILLSGPFRRLDAGQRQGISISCPGFYDTDPSPFLKPEKVFRLSVSDFGRQCLRWLEEASEAAPTITWREPEKADFERAFARIQNLIVQGQIDKAVPVVMAQARQAVTPVMRCRWLASLLQTPATLNPFGWWDGDEGLMGATPEILFRTEGRSLETMALAGTLAKADGSKQDLWRSAKEQHEHKLVVDDLKQVLSAFGRVRVGETEVMELPTLFHLKTAIHVDLDENPDAAALVKALHPTAALGVSPRLFGWRWMAELPGQSERGRFGAPWTMDLGEGRLVSLVAIRCVQWKNEDLWLGSGCGVVGASALEAEWNELARKRASVLQAMGMNR